MTPPRRHLAAAPKLRHIFRIWELAMRFVPLVLVALCVLPGPCPARAQSCQDDYVTTEHVTGTIVQIKPAPDPFSTADIDMTGPKPCERMWMQVLKKDAAQCKEGDTIEATGVITSDPENHAWQINPVMNTYMTIGDDFRCHS